MFTRYLSIYTSLSISIYLYLYLCRNKYIFLETGKKCPNLFEEKPWLCPPMNKVSHLKISFRNAQEKISKCFRCGPFLVWSVDETFIEASPALKTPGCVSNLHMQLQNSLHLPYLTGKCTYRKLFKAPRLDYPVRKDS